MKQGDAVLHPHFLLEVALERHFAAVLYSALRGEAPGLRAPRGLVPLPPCSLSQPRFVKWPSSAGFGSDETSSEAVFCCEMTVPATGGRWKCERCPVF